MVVGSGLIASAFKEYKAVHDILIFASGVSNSSETSHAEFSREENLLRNTIANNDTKKFVYFSTCSIYDPTVSQSPYVLHKRRMEEIIAMSLKRYYIYRLPQVVGMANNDTFINYLFRSICTQQPINIYKNSTRNLVAVEDVFRIVSHLLQMNMYENQVINIASPDSHPVLEIVMLIERITGKLAQKTVLDKGAKLEISNIEIRDIEIYEEIFIENYTYNILDRLFQNNQQSFGC